ncbi:hypothetical protein HFO38_15715 [Rhizobium leguminosarum]|uniref:PD-(D/E)XK nuclease domain-containing protein n=1 Tax=Rhizobium leguminosarum TaxID=384 RepID=UPI001C94FE91|nr:hypothetical protein [Rhizobium leguminosarum]MBY5704154.1 hypothetical protein [Rhizobium leguminosarum]
MNDTYSIAARALASAQNRIQECRLQIFNISDADAHMEGPERDDYLNDLTTAFKTQTYNAKASIGIVYNILGLTDSLRGLEADFEAVRDTVGVVSYVDPFDGAFNEAIDYLQARLELLVPLLEVPSQTQAQRMILTRVLRQLPQFIEHGGMLPTREKDVQDQLHPVLRLSFPDVIREAAVPKQTKTYFPDFGIDSIATAVEVKFVETKSKAALAIGGLYEDMKGYAASVFTHFIGLVYMTGNFLTQEQVEAELRKVQTPKNWEVYVVFGMGAPNPSPVRPKKAKTAPPDQP